MSWWKRWSTTAGGPWEITRWGRRPGGGAGRQRLHPCLLYGLFPWQAGQSLWDSSEGCSGAWE